MSHESLFTHQQLQWRHFCTALEKSSWRDDETKRSCVRPNCQKIWIMNGRQGAAHGWRGVFYLFVLFFFFNRNTEKWQMWRRVQWQEVKLWEKKMAPFYYIFSFLWQINYYCIMKEYKTQILQANLGTTLNGKSDFRSHRLSVGTDWNSVLFFLFVTLTHRSTWL